jgi:uncharacterized surface protein with fasciclin (FAS1) repeats
MRLNRFIATASAAALIACPAIALAQPAAQPAPPPAAAPPAAPALPTVPRITGGADIYDTLKSAGEFTILLKAVDQAGLAPVLQRYPNLTFFAPTDQAFNALPPDALSKLLAPNDTAANELQQILKYHLINAQVDASKIRGAKGPVVTVEGKPVSLDGSNQDDLKADSADIIQPDIRTTNGGIIHVVDKVLIPSDSPVAAQLAPAGAAP